MTRILALSLLLSVAPIQAGPADDRTRSPYFLVEGSSVGGVSLPLEATDVAIDITGVIAEVVVRQRYRNDGLEPIHARYVFPASTRATVHGMRMTVDDEVVEAVLQERAEARRTFETAKQQGRSASLLEQQRANVFTMRVSNLMPGDRIDVELRYSELLVPAAGVYELVYPTVVGPRYGGATGGGDLPLVAEVPQPELRLAVRIVAGMPLEELVSPSHAIFVDWSGLAQARVQLDPAETHAADRDFVLRYRLAGSRIAEGLLLETGASENYFLLMVQPPDRVSEADLPPREYVFVLDVSGSMSGFPLDTAKALLRDLVGSLQPADRFNVVLFAGSSYTLAPASLPASDDNLAAAIALIEGQHGGGGTELLAALERALALPQTDGVARSLVVVTDGFIATERAVFAHVREHLGSANVFAFGIGSSVNRLLIEGLARAGLGEPFIVAEPNEAAAVALRFRDYLRFPLLTGVRIEYAGFDAYDMEPSAIPDLLAERPLVVQGKWRGEPHGTIRISGTTGAGAYERTIEVAQIAAASDGQGLAHLWARTRLAALSDFGEVSMPANVLRAEITRLGLGYNLLTEYTSFVAVHRRIRNPDGAGQDVDQSLALPRGVSVSTVGVGAEPDAALLVLLLAAGIGGAALWRRAGWGH